MTYYIDTEDGTTAYDTPDGVANAIAEMACDSPDRESRLDILAPFAALYCENDPHHGAGMMLSFVEDVIADVVEAQAMQLEAGSGILVMGDGFAVSWAD